MRTTLSIDDDVLAVAKALAEQHKQSIGEIISALARQALRPATAPASVRNGIPLLPVRAEGEPLTLELVNRLRDDLP